MGASSGSNEGTSLACHGQAGGEARGHLPHKVNADQQKDHLQDSMRCSRSAVPASEAYLAVEQPGNHMITLTGTTWYWDSIWITDTASMFETRCEQHVTIDISKHQELLCF